MTLIVTLLNSRDTAFSEMTSVANTGGEVVPQDRLRERDLTDAHVLFLGPWSDMNAEALKLAYELTRSSCNVTVSFALLDELADLERSLHQGAVPARPVNRDQIAIFPLLPVAEDEGDGWRVLGDLARPDRVRTALAAGSKTLVVSTHGDGVDARMPGDLQLCCAPWEEQQGTASGRRPECVRNRWCYRLKMDLDRARDHERMITPKDISVETIIYDSCLSMQSGNSLFDPRWLMARKLLQAGSCDNLVCFTGYLIDDSESLLDLSQRIASGTPPEIAVKAFANSVGSVEADRRAYLLHGPRGLADLVERCRSGTGPRTEGRPPGSTRPTGQTRRAPPEIVADADILDWFTWSRAWIRDERLAHALDTALAADPPARILESVADVLSTVEPGALWLSRGEKQRRDDGMQCPRCGWSVAAIELRMPPFFRRFITCHNCNYYEDTDGKAVAALDLDESGLLKIRVSEPCEVRVKVTPAGEPKSLPRFRRLGSPPAVTTETAAVDTTTSYAFRAESPGRFDIDIRGQMKVAPYFIAVLGLTPHRYSCQTYTVRERDGFVGSAAFEVAAPKERSMS